MKKTITEVETAIENRIAELEEEYELDIYDRNDWETGADEILETMTF